MVRPAQKQSKMINLAKFRKETGDDFLWQVGSRICNFPNPDERAIKLAKMAKEIDIPSSFLGLGIDRSSNYETNHRSYHPSQDYMDCSSDHPMLEQKDKINGCSTNCNNPKPDERVIKLAKMAKEIDIPSAFLGLGINRSSNYGTNHRSYDHPTQGYMDYSSDHPMLEQKDKSNVRKGGPRRSREDEYPPEPINPPQELVQMIGPNVRPVFLYMKQLSEWDTRRNQNRLFVNDRKKLMDFLTEEERLAVEDEKKPGIEVVGIDRMGREYEMRSNKWESLDKAVVNKGWFAILDANGAGRGDWVHLWGFRRDGGRFCLYVDFRGHSTDQIKSSSS